MTQPELHTFAPNIDGCQNAIEYASKGEWVKAVRWLEDEEQHLSTASVVTTTTKRKPTSKPKPKKQV